ncbi:MAG: ABC transporter substrate-binding protein [Candidatus Dependentiae bacterium]|nr:ABC transporter substrate-binding protein [Candidatus Dependentiae bacterium]
MKYYSCFLLLFFPIVHATLPSIKTLAQYRSWFATIPESRGRAVPGHHGVAALNDPSFSEASSGYSGYFFKMLGVRFGLLPGPWDLTQLRGPLTRITQKYREAKKRKTAEHELFLEEGERVIVVGSLHGSIFSLMRDLTELEERGLIDNKLQLAERTYLIFLGDLVNYSPHSFELLDLLLSILAQNDGRAICVRGRQETAGFWENFSAMRDPLKHWRILWDDAAAIAQLKDALNAFFDELPERLIIRQKANPKFKILCSGREPHLSTREAAQVDALIMGERPNNTTWSSKGLEFFGFYKGVAAWSLASCPNPFYRDVFQLFYDAFISVTLGPSVAETVIESFTRDTRTSQPFKKEEFSLMFGFPLHGNRDILKAPILKVGSTAPLTAQIAGIGRGLKAGIEAAAMRANREGGVMGTLIHPIVLDDYDIPRFAHQNIRSLKERYGVDLLLCTVGTATLLTYLDQVRAGDFQLFFPVTGGEEFRHEDLKHIIHLRTSYAQECISAINFVIDEYLIRKFTIIYPADAYGKQLARAAHEILKKRGITKWLDIPFANDSLLSAENIEKVRNSGAGAIALFFNSNTRATTFLSQVGANFCIDKHFFTVSIVDTLPFRFYVETYGLKFNVSCILPNPVGRHEALITEYLDEMTEQHESIDNFSLEGYVAASLFFEAIRHVDSPVTGKKIMQWLESLRDYNFKGFSLTFHPETRSFDLPSWIRTEEGKWRRAGEM